MILKYLFVFLCFAFSAKLLADPCQDAATGRLETSAQNKLLSFPKAREKVRLAGISTERQYRIWQKDHPDMPSNPNRAYPDQWTSWGDFLGTGRVRSKKEDILPFERARDKARLAGISSKRQYIEWQKDHPDMPSEPDKAYPDQWPGWGDFLGTGKVRTGRVRTGKESFLSFERAREKVRSAGISSVAQYRKWQKNHPDMPSNPNQTYKAQWTSWGDFLGTGRIRSKKEDILPFERARDKARLAGISSVAQYREWQKNHPDMPSDPPQFYKGQWPGWGDFLGTGKVRTGEENFLSFKEARAKARNAGISSRRKYQTWQKQHPDMPSRPDQTYKAQWKGWRHFLGTGRVRTRKDPFLSFEEARKKARLAGISSAAKYKKWQKNHPDMPHNPNQIYKHRWKGWRYFLRINILSFERARNKARLAGISSAAKYKKWQKDHPDMPSNPPQFYKKWKGWRNFLGINVLPFEQAREKVRSAGILSARKYRGWQKDHLDMPSHPNEFYKEWQGWRDFLGKL